MEWTGKVCENGNIQWNRVISAENSNNYILNLSDSTDEDWKETHMGSCGVSPTLVSLPTHVKDVVKHNKIINTFNSTGCPNNDVSLNSKITSWATQDKTVVFNDMFNYCTSVNNGTANDSEISICCGNNTQNCGQGKLSCKLNEEWVAEHVDDTVVEEVLNGLTNQIILIGDNYQSITSNKLIGEINIKNSYRFDITINPANIANEFVNIMHNINASTYFNKCCDYTDLVPAIWFWPSSTRLRIRVGTKKVKNETIDTPVELPLNQDTTLSVIVYYNKFIILMSGAVNAYYEKNIDPNRFEGDTKMYLSNPVDVPALAVVKNVKFRNIDYVRSKVARKLQNHLLEQDKASEKIIVPPGFLTIGKNELLTKINITKNFKLSMSMDVNKSTNYDNIISIRNDGNKEILGVYYNGGWLIKYVTKNKEHQVNMLLPVIRFDDPNDSWNRWFGPANPLNISLSIFVHLDRLVATASYDYFYDIHQTGTEKHFYKRNYKDTTIIGDKYEGNLNLYTSFETNNSTNLKVGNMIFKNQMIPNISTVSELLTYNNIIIGDNFIQFGDNWRIGQFDDSHFTIGHRNGATMQIFKKNGTSRFKTTDYNCWNKSADSPKGVQFGNKFIKIGDWTLGEKTHRIFAVNYQKTRIQHFKEFEVTDKFDSNFGDPDFTSPSSNYGNMFDINSQTRNVEIGDRFLQLGNFRIGEINGQFCITKRDWGAIQLFRTDGTYMKVINSYYGLHDDVQKVQKTKSQFSLFDKPSVRISKFRYDI